MMVVSVSLIVISLKKLLHIIIVKKKLLTSNSLQVLNTSSTYSLFILHIGRKVMLSESQGGKKDHVLTHCDYFGDKLFVFNRMC